MFERLRRGNSDDAADQDDDTEEQNREAEREELRDALGEEVEDVLDDNEDTERAYVEVAAATADDLRELDAFDEEHAHETSDALRFASRWEDSVAVHIGIVNTDKTFKVSVELVRVEGEVTNDIAEDFAATFERTISGKTFDPMAERHKRPVLSIQPW